MRSIYPHLFSLMICLGFISSSYALNLDANKNISSKTSPQEPRLIDPFDSTPFFQSNQDIFQQMDKMQQAMHQLMNSQFSKIQNGLVSRYPDLQLSNANNIQIQETKGNLIYKVKLPKGTDNKVDVSVQNGHLTINSHFTQKITNEDKNNKSIKFSHSSQTQSFNIPNGYDEKSMTTQMKGTNLIISFKKRVS